MPEAHAKSQSLNVCPRIDTRRLIMSSAARVAFAGDISGRVDAPVGSWARTSRELPSPRR